MKLILITGLDGSGKSTLLDRIEENAKGKPFAFIRVPKIDVALFKQREEIYNTALFINKMHSDADALKIPQLKVIALFSSMLIFKELLNELNNKQIDIIFCERHPLIDTGVYAKFYSDKMNPASLPASIINAIDTRYCNEIAYLFNLLRSDKAGKISFFTYLQFIHNWFSVGQKHELADLATLFNISLPDKVIYLSASPEVLIERLKSRKILEAHESSAVFKKLTPVYDKILSECGVTIEKINADSFSNLDAAFEKIKQDYI